MKWYFLIILILAAGCQSKTELSFKEVGTPIESYFCPKDNCEYILAQTLADAHHSIHCAFFDLDLDSVIEVMDIKSKKMDVKLVMDKDNYFNQTKGIPFIVDDDNQLSHNKFCVIDGSIVTTGSFNPTKNGAYKNNNNLLIIPSKYMAKEFEKEFDELWNKRFGRGEKLEDNWFTYNGADIELYFCPEDSCSGHLINKLLDAKHSIYIMVFSFTDEGVADAILMSDAADIKGIFDNLQAGQSYSQFKRLQQFGFDVKREQGKGLLHHKVFIIDNETVVTGSYNPTRAADTKNDENMLIIKDRRIAKEYLEEFNHLFSTE